MHHEEPCGACPPDQQTPVELAAGTPVQLHDGSVVTVIEVNGAALDVAAAQLAERRSIARTDVARALTSRQALMYRLGLGIDPPSYPGGGAR